MLKIPSNPYSQPPIATQRPSNIVVLPLQFSPEITENFSLNSNSLSSNPRKFFNNIL
jgi:hypothetical protein